MNNQIRPLDDGTFAIGVWMKDSNSNLIFFDVNHANDFETAVEMVNGYDDEDFLFAKYEIDLIGGIQSAKEILRELEKQSAIAVTFPKGAFDAEKLCFVDAETHARLVEESSQTLGILTITDIQRNLHKLRFLSL
ncbi:hypothetical protein [Acinetobacter baumannii]|uniref:hypothetical protein n=1 Tax=Acinetobacter baumannii TaxID=470 RepID=UPI000DF14A02|nr:hypothetical protein [Acinetobacter baumannii]RCT89663.1 hypothetical protein DVA68_15795 [Acinetobacter baumannii]